MRRTPSKSAGRRGGFTLVELLVAAALTVLVMAILATAFQTGMQTLSQLKSVVGLSEHLRSVETIILRDLSATHLEQQNSLGTKVLVSSSQRAAVWNDTNGGLGYFRVDHPTAATTDPRNPGPFHLEGAEEGVPSYRATNQSLAFTVRRRGETADDIFAADATGLSLTPPAMDIFDQSRRDYATEPQFAGEWAEIALFLSPSAILTQDESGGTGLQLYTLHRRQRALVPSAIDIFPIRSATIPNPADHVGLYPELSVSASPMNLNSGADSGTGKQAVVNSPLTVNKTHVGTSGRLWYTNRLMSVWNYPNAGTAANVTAATTPRVPPSDPSFGGSDILLTNVVSMHILVMTDTSSNAYLNEIPGTGSYPHSLDTADPNTSKPVLRAVQIKLRVYDTKNRITRQVTLTQDL